MHNATAKDLKLKVSVAHSTYACKRHVHRYTLDRTAYDAFVLNNVCSCIVGNGAAATASAATTDAVTQANTAGVD
jgi:hypothetical protein